MATASSISTPVGEYGYSASTNGYRYFDPGNSTWSIQGTGAPKIVPNVLPELEALLVRVAMAKTVDQTKRLLSDLISVIIKLAQANVIQTGPPGPRGPQGITPAEVKEIKEQIKDLWEALE